jgi:cold shock CspA family protein
MRADLELARHQSKSKKSKASPGYLGRVALATASMLWFGIGAASAQSCTETVVAKVVALDQAFYVNRFGALQAGGMMFALERDVISLDGGNALKPGSVMLRPDKRPRPLTLRVNKGQCLEIQFQNLLTPKPVSQQMATATPPAVGSIPTVPEPGGYQANRQVLVPAETQPNDQNGDQHQPATRYAGVHVAGLEWGSSSADDGSFVGANDVADNDMGGTAKLGGLVPPGGRIKTTLYAAEEGAFLLTSGGATVGARLAFGGQLSEGLFGSVIVEPQTAEYYRSQVTRADLDAATAQSKALPEGWKLGPRGPACAFYKGDLRVWQLAREPKDPRDPNRGTSCVTAVDKDGKPVDPIAVNGYLQTVGKQPIINYDAVGGTKRAPALSMLAGKRGDRTRELVSADLTAIITGPYAGPFGKAPPQIANETYPEAQQPYREFAIHYHDDFMATQAFAQFRSGDMQYTLQGGRDFFAINYGMGGIGAAVLANRLNIGPANECATCKFEEFFLSSWPNGDPAMVVDQPVNVVQQPNPPKPDTQATKAFYPDDPSNVYHSYLRDHVRFRILHAGTNITHVHHQHAHQWLHSPKSGVSAYRDSQMISPGAAYTLEMVYGGSGNKNLTMGDSIFHCHFYPHFAQGMWALWRVHDVFERGTLLDDYGVAAKGDNRALPDGEIATGTPIPGLVPLPTLAMAPVPARVELVSAPVQGTSVVRNQVKVNSADLAAGLQPGYPFFVAGIAGQRAPHPPMSYAPELDANGKQVEIGGVKQRLDGGLPRNIVVAEQGTPYEHHNRWDFSKDADALVAKELEEEGTAVEKAAMSNFSKREHASFTSAGTPANFIYNGQKPVQGAPFANPAVHYDGTPVKFCEPSDPNCNGVNFESRKLTYKSANVQTDVVLNKQGWHYPQQRMSMLWEDVKPTLDGKRRPEPLFMRVNSGDIVEFWLTNLIPTYYELDDFQVRTPTDVVGQHIHLVKFDVLASDGAGNGFNYESGTLAAEEVRALIGAVNKGGGLLKPDGTSPRTLAAKSIPFFETQFGKNDPLILGAQATVELWYADPLTDICLPGDQKDNCPKEGLDRTMGTVFTHDHFGPSTHQQAGLYAGLVIEPRNSEWLTASATPTTPALSPMGGTDPATGKPIVLRPDGGPTTWAAVINDGGKRHREYLLEFQDRQLAYKAHSRRQPKPYLRYEQPPTIGLVSLANPNGAWGWVDPPNSINPPSSSQFAPSPQLVTNSFGAGAWSLNYRNEPLDIRLNPYDGTRESDTAFGFASIKRANPLLNVQPIGPIWPQATRAAAAPSDHTAHAATPDAAPGDDTLSIAGDIVNGKPVWVVNDKPLDNNGSVELKKGQLVRFSVKQGTHGILFKSQADAEAVFDISHSPQASKFALNPRGPNTCNLANSYGTVPQAAGTGDNTIADVRVLADAKISGPGGLDFECSQHCANMAGVFTLGGGGDTLSIAGDIVNGKPVWVVNDKPLDNNGSVELKKGQLVRFSVKQGTHGILFKNQADAEAVFDISHSPQASKFALNPRGPNTCNLANSYGTVPQAAGTGDNTIADVRVLADAKISGPGGLDFECSQHCANMAGVFSFETPVVNITGDVANGKPVWRLNGAVMANGESVPLIPGQKVRFTVANGTHGLLFPDQATADAIFDIAGSPEAHKFVANPRGPNTCSLANSYGTVPQAAVANPKPGDNTIAELVVKKPFNLAQPGQWMCSQHCQNMQGLFVPVDTTYLVADADETRWLIDNDTLPNNTPIVLEPGRKLRVSANQPGDTLFFRDKDAPAALFNEASAFTPMNLCSIDGVGLTLKTDGTYTELTAKTSTTAVLASFMSGKLCQKMEGYFQPHIAVAAFTYPPKFEGAEPFDPYTPLMRAYPGETVEVRTLVGAHMASHSFNMHGVKWLFEQNSPNSGFRSTQGMGISEYYQMRFEVPTTNTGADYLYASTSDTKGLEYGQWGLLRAYQYDKQPADFPPLGPAPKTTAVCPADAPAKSSYKVSVVTADTLPGKALVYNDRGPGQILGAAPLIYVNDDDLDLNAKPIRMKPGLGKRIEPLILRAAAGDCIDVTVTNRIPLAYKPPWRAGVGVFKDVNLYTSRHVSIHPQQVGLDILTGNGVTIGMNPAKTVWKTGDSVRLRWYAGSIGTDGSHTPVELGAIGLSPADPLMQHPLGLLGALIVEPAGATWQTDQNSRAQATVTAYGKTFRELVLVLQDDVQLELVEPPVGSASPSKTSNPNYSRAFNYRTDPLPYRYKDPNWEMPTFNVPVGIARALSDSLVGGDPQTPVLAVSKGTPTRLRVVHPGGLSEQTFTLSGHPWQEEPFRNNSRDIGDNGASQWFGGRDAFGANDQVNILLSSAGGRNKVAGDYLYRSFIGEEFTFGLWGVMRVGEPGRDIVAIARASDGRSGFGFNISGANTVNPDTGKMADSVTITASVRLPDARNPKLIKCKVPVDPVSGDWSSATCADSAQGKLDVSRARPIEVVSSEGGRASITNPIPVAALPPSPALLSQTIGALGAEPQKREAVQFSGERTPTLRIPGANLRAADPIPSTPPRPDQANEPSSGPGSSEERRPGVGDGETPRH